MINPPTDRLHKFISNAGVTLIFIGITYPIDKYNEYELERIQSLEKRDATKYAHVRFAQKVKEATVGIHSIHDPVTGKLKPNISAENFRRIEKKFNEDEPEVRRLEKEMYDELTQFRKHSNLAEHYEFMKKLWFFIGGFSLVIGIIFSCIGFRRWLAQPKSSR